MTEKQKIFCDEYLIDLNATRAYKAAYPNVKRYEAAQVNGSKLLSNAMVAAYIAERQLERQRRTEITQDKVVKELASIAFAEASDDQESDLKYSSKLKALELLGKHLGMFKYRVEMSTLAGEQSKLAELLEQRKQRREAGKDTEQ